MTTETSTKARELVALNADIVGYSRLLADNMEQTASVLDDYQRLVKAEVTKGNGILINFVGDNFMSVFDETTDAMRAAIAITTAVEERNRNEPEQRRVRFRMGIDRGPVVITDEGQYMGDALNIAARIQAIALPGGLSVSGDVYRALDEPELRFRPTGRQDLKNIPEHIQVYQFSDLPKDAPATTEARRLAWENPTIAVLPAHMDDLDPALHSAGRLILSDLLHRLARIPNLKVIDATDPSSHAGTRAANDETIRYMLETGLMQIGERVRVYTKLVEVATINLVSSQRWDVTAESIFDLSDEVADEVARSIEIELVVGEPARLYNEIGDPEAQEDIYQGWFQITSGTQVGWNRSVELFSKVTQSHPDQPAGHGLLAYAYWAGAAEGFSDDPENSLRKARSHANQAAKMGDPTGLSDMVLASILMMEGDAEGALQKAEAAEITRPTCDVTYALEGSVHRYMGDWQKAVDLLDRAMRLTAVAKPWYPTVQACSFYMGGRFEDAAALAEDVLSHRPDSLEAMLVLAASQVELGLERRARATAEMIKDRFPAVKVDQWLERSPYQDPQVVEKWKADLRLAGVLDPV